MDNRSGIRYWTWDLREKCNGGARGFEGIKFDVKAPPFLWDLKMALYASSINEFQC